MFVFLMHNEFVTTDIEPGSILSIYLVGWCSKWFSIVAELDDTYYEMRAQPHFMLIENIRDQSRNQQVF